MSRSIIIIFSIPFIILLAVGGYFFWDINRPIASLPADSVEPENIPPLPPPKSETVKPVVSAPIWKDPASPNPESTPAPQPTPESNKITIHNTKNSSNTSVNDFYQNTATHLLNEKKDAVLKEDPNYYIDYIATGQSFGISLVGNDLQTSRNAGEQDLLKILGVTKDQACKLNVSVTVPGSVNENAAGVDYHLSFCPNGVSLPK